MTTWLFPREKEKAKISVVENGWTHFLLLKVWESLDPKGKKDLTNRIRQVSPYFSGKDVVVTALQLKTKACTN